MRYSAIHIMVICVIICIRLYIRVYTDTHAWTVDTPNYSGSVYTGGRGTDIRAIQRLGGNTTVRCRKHVHQSFISRAAFNRHIILQQFRLEGSIHAGLANLPYLSVTLLLCTRLAGLSFCWDQWRSNGFGFGRRLLILIYFRCHSFLQSNLSFKSTKICTMWKNRAWGKMPASGLQ